MRAGAPRFFLQLAESAALALFAVRQLRTLVSPKRQRYPSSWLSDGRSRKYVLITQRFGVGP